MIRLRFASAFASLRRDKPARQARPIIINGLKMLAGLAAIAAAELIAILILSGGDADAHDAPTGWTYPWSCCSSMDCKEVADTAIEATRFGYRITATGETIIYSDVRIKDSPDGHFHWCAHQAGIDAGHTICLFVPPRGF